MKRIFKALAILFEKLAGTDIVAEYDALILDLVKEMILSEVGE